jgi:hypothetical protein
MQFPERSLAALHLFEPSLEFAYGQTTAHPKDGLFLYGPHQRPKKAKEIRVGVVGTQAGINHFRSWATQLKKRVEVPPPGKGEKKDRLHLANFPGIEEVFAISFDDSEFVTYPIDLAKIDAATRVLNLHEAVAKVVQLYVERVRRHLDNEERAVDVWVLVVPEIIFERCKPGSKRAGLPMEKGDFGKKQKGRSDVPLLDAVIDRGAEDIFDDAPDFHRQVKAAFLSISPTQLLRETTLAPEAFLNKAGYAVRRMQDRATIAWNIATGLYYKTQPLPRGNCPARGPAFAISVSSTRTCRTTRTITPVARRRCFSARATALYSGALTGLGRRASLNTISNRKPPKTYFGRSSHLSREARVRSL